VTRRPEKLTYTTPTVSNMTPVQAMRNMNELFMFGSTTSTWERRCAASLAASRRRRGK
jgi:hypothetical protein